MTEVCATADIGKPITTAGFRLHNSGPSLITIDSFAARSPHKLSVLGAYVVPLGKSASIGVADGWPPAVSERPAGFAWDERASVKGATVRSGQTYVLAIGLSRPSSAVGTAKGFEMKYHAGGTDYVVRTQNAVRLTSSCGAG